MGPWGWDFSHPNQGDFSHGLNSNSSSTPRLDSVFNAYTGIFLFFLIWFLVTDGYTESCCTENYSLKIFNGSSCTRYSIHLLFLINDKFWELQVSSHLIILSINAGFQSEGHKVQIKLLTQRFCVLQSLYQPKSLSKFKLMLYIVKQIYSEGIF